MVWGRRPQENAGTRLPWAQTPEMREPSSQARIRAMPPIVPPLSVAHRARRHRRARGNRFVSEAFVAAPMT